MPDFPNLVLDKHRHANVPMSGMLAITDNDKNGLRVPFPLDEKEMQYMSLNQLTLFGKGMLEIEISDYISNNLPIQQLFLQFPRPWLEWPRNVLSEIRPNTSPQEVMGIIESLGYDVVFS